MANILEYLRGVLVDPHAQGSFRADPGGYLTEGGFGDLTGEDVVEAVVVLRRSLPPDAAAALSVFDDEDDLPAVRPAPGETDLDAAVRVLTFAADQVPGSVQLTKPAAEAAPEPVEEELIEVESELPAADEAVAWGEAPAEPEPEFEPDVESEPIAAASDIEQEPMPVPTSTDLGPVTVDVSALPSVTAFAESMAATASDARARVDEALRQIVAAAEADARTTAGGYEELLRQAESDANAIRAQANADAAGLRDQANGELTAARQYHEQLRAEAEDLLHRAREQAEETRRHSDELLAATQAESDAAKAEIEVRKTELRDAERQLKERLTGIDSLFRTVLRDDASPED